MDIFYQGRALPSWVWYVCALYTCVQAVFKGVNMKKNDVYGLPGVTVMVIDSCAS